MLTTAQIAAIVALLMAFGVDASEVNKIEIMLKPPIVLGAQQSVTTPTVYQPTFSTATDTPQVLVTPTVAVQPAIIVPLDTTPPKYELCELSSGNLRLLSNEKLDKIEISTGTLGTPNVDGVWQPSRHYYYEIPIQMTTRFSYITMFDAAGNSTWCRIDAGL